MASVKQKPKTIEIDGKEYDLNEDGLPIGLPLDFATLQRALVEQRNAKEAKEDDADRAGSVLTANKQKA